MDSHKMTSSWLLLDAVIQFSVLDILFLYSFFYSMEVFSPQAYTALRDILTRQLFVFL